MTSDRGAGHFWITNHLANPVIRLLLRSPVDGGLGRHLAVLRYHGRRSGQRHDLIVQYARHDATVWIVPGQPDLKIWWRNLREPSAVELRLAGQELRGTAVALEGSEHPDEVRRGLRQLPRVAKALGVPLSSGEAQQVEMTDVVKRAVVVRIDLDGKS